MGGVYVVPRVFSPTHLNRRTPWVAIIATTAVAIAVMLIVGEGGVEVLASATVQFLLAVFTMVCVCGLVLRRDGVEHEHYEAPKALLMLGVGVNLALFLYVAISDLRDLANGEVTMLKSSSVVCLILLGVGMVLYLANNVGKRKLDAVPPGGSR